MVSIKYFAIYGRDGKLIQTMDRAKMLVAIRLNTLEPGLTIQTFETKAVDVDEDIEIVTDTPNLEDTE